MVRTFKSVHYIGGIRCEGCLLSDVPLHVCQSWPFIHFLQAGSEVPALATVTACEVWSMILFTCELESSNVSRTSDLKN